MKVVGTATPKEPSEQWNASWEFSTGDELMIQWESTSRKILSFDLKSKASPDAKVNRKYPFLCVNYVTSTCPSVGFI